MEGVMVNDGGMVKYKGNMGVYTAWMGNNRLVWKGVKHKLGNGGK